jgi:hypothetical protein
MEHGRWVTDTRSAGEEIPSSLEPKVSLSCSEEASVTWIQFVYAHRFYITAISVLGLLLTSDHFIKIHRIISVYNPICPPEAKLYFKRVLYICYMCSM